MQRMTPADCVISAFGGVRRTARAVGREPGAVILWRRRGMIPNAVQVVIMGLVACGSVKLTAEELILGRQQKTPDGSGV